MKLSYNVTSTANSYGVDVSSTHVGVDMAKPDPTQDAIEILKVAYTKVKHDSLRRSVSHAMKHLRGLSIANNVRFTKQFLESDEEYDAEAKCVTKEHAADYGCNCIKASCGCAINLDNESQCSRCEQCSDCCSNSGDCSYCEGCETTVYSGDMCSRCDRCMNGCCGCFHCDSCDKRKDKDSRCSNCGYCENCCECWYCNACGESHSSDTEHCGDCDHCMDTCSCDKPCKGCEAVTNSDELCSCGYCGDCGCKCPPKPLPPVGSVLATTQKAKGLVALGMYNKTYYTPAFNLTKADKADPRHLLGRFVRPCPLTPRHGFVDSRQVSTLEEAQTIIEETLAADKDAELLLMNLIKAEYSAVWTRGVIVIGPGNDGATAGRKSVTIPVAGDYLAPTPLLLSAAGIKQSPYVEMLWADRKQQVAVAGNVRQVRRAEVVQLRDGPELPVQTDYILADTVVTNVVKAEGDLLAWETLMKNQPAGTVVYHPEGSLASHYAVHAVLNKIPVMISREPVVGETLSPAAGATPKQPNMDEVRRGFHFGVTAKTDHHSACYAMLIGCHSTALWLGRYDVLLGMALGFTYRLAVTAGIGEWRHRPSRRDKDCKHSREGLYDLVWNRTHKLPRLYMQTLKDFRIQGWQSGMGGEKWYEFTRWAGEILNHMLAGDFVKAMEAMNQAIHASHNNGWGFNKFAQGNAMNDVALNPVYAVTYCGPLLYDAVKKAESKEVVDKWFSSLKRLPMEKADGWLDNAGVSLAKAYCAVASLQEDKLVIQCKPCNNTKAIQTHIVPVPSNILVKVKSLVAHPYHGFVDPYRSSPSKWFHLQRTSDAKWKYINIGAQSLSVSYSGEISI